MKSQLLQKLMAMFILILTLSSICSATDITSNITTTTVWTTAGSPYIITPPTLSYIEVGNSQSAITLTIEAGVTVKFVDGKSLHIIESDGLIVEGSANNPVIFTTNSVEEDYGKWGNILFYGDSYGEMSNFELKCGGNTSGGSNVGGIRLEDYNYGYPNVQVFNGKIHQCYNYGIVTSNSDGHSVLQVDSSEVYDILGEEAGDYGYGIHFFNCDEDNSLAIKNNVHDCDYGIVLHGAGGKVLNNIVTDCDFTGIYAEGNYNGEVINNVVTDSEVGIHFDEDYSGTEVKNNIVSECPISYEGTSVLST